ncbi:hypothetical protein D3C73_1350090 [compost metagenome]
MQEAGERDIIASTEAAIGIGHVLWNKEHRYALGSSRGTLDPRQYHVHDVLSQLMVATGDEHFLARNSVASIVVWARRCPDVSQCRALTWFRKRHRTAEAAVHH